MVVLSTELPIELRGALMYYMCINYSEGRGVG